MKKKSNILYNIITACILILPTSIYLFVVATIYGIEPDVITTNDTVNLLNDNDKYYVRVEEGYKYSGGQIEYNDIYDVWVIRVREKDIIKVKGGFLQLAKNKETKNIELIEYDKKLLKKEENYKIPIAFFISAAGALIVGAIISGKMNWQKKHPRIAVFISLLLGTTILFIINFFIGGMLGIFITATISWGIYTIRYYITKYSDVEKEKQEKVNTLLEELQKAKQELI